LRKVLAGLACGLVMAGGSVALAAPASAGDWVPSETYGYGTPLAECQKNGRTEVSRNGWAAYQCLDADVPGYYFLYVRH
jgi:hypothetical protein